jgi:hypothetical protein
MQIERENLSKVRADDEKWLRQQFANSQNEEQIGTI